MVSKKKTERKDRDERREDRRETYKGYEIIIPGDERRKRIFINGRPIKWGKASDTYYLDVYAYDRGKTLDETIRRYIDSLEKAGNIGKEPE